MFESLVASAVVAACSAVGVLFFRKSGHLRGTHRFMLPLAVGVFLGIVFFELIPETLEASAFGPAAVLAGFFFFYLVGHLLTTHHQYHEHDGNCASDPAHCPAGASARMLLAGDAIHNVADGIIITSAFLLDPTLGLIITAGVILHELPQEVAEFGVLISAGYTRSRAVALNLLSASSVFIGALFTIAFASFTNEYIWLLTGFAAGNLLYIATGDLIPELRSSHRHHFYQTFFVTLLGVALIAVALTLSHSLFGAG